jgi:hypothetical protein
VSTGRPTVEDHLRGRPTELVALFQQVLGLVRACGPFDLEPTRVGVTFHGKKRIFGSAKLGRDGVRGHLVLPEQVEGDRRFVKIEPLTRMLYFHGFLVRDSSDLDASFRRHVEAAYRTGQGRATTRSQARK